MSEIVDLQRIKDTSDGDIEFETELLNEFMNDGREHMEAMEAFMAQGNIEEVRKSAHTLKGMSGNVGADGAHAAALTVQEAADAGTLAADHIASMRSVFENTLTIFRKYLDSVN